MADTWSLLPGSGDAWSRLQALGGSGDAWELLDYASTATGDAYSLISSLDTPSECLNAWGDSFSNFWGDAWGDCQNPQPESFPKGGMSKRRRAIFRDDEELLLCISQYLCIASNN